MVNLNELGLTHRQFAKKIKISRDVLHSLSHEKDIQRDSLFKIICWLDVDMTDYLMIKIERLDKREKWLNYKNYLKEKESY